MHGIHANMTDKEVCTGHIHRAYPQYDLWPAKLSSDLFCLAQGREWLSLNWHSFKEDVIGLDWHSSSGRGTCALGEVENMLIAGSRWKRVAQLETANVEQGWTFRKRGDRGGGRRRLCWGGLLGSGGGGLLKGCGAGSTHCALSALRFRPGSLVQARLRSPAGSIRAPRRRGRRPVPLTALRRRSSAGVRGLPSCDAAVGLREAMPDSEFSRRRLRRAAGRNKAEQVSAGPRPAAARGLGLAAARLASRLSDDAAQRP